MTAEEARMATAWNSISEEIKDAITWSVSDGYRETVRLERPSNHEIDDLKTLGYIVDEVTNASIIIKW